jgi:1-deoxy-D-xylulose-5-phosphate synthase
LPFGKASIERKGKKLAILSFGTLLYPALQVAEKLNATVVNMRWAKPIDEEMLLEVASSHQQLVSLEEGCLMGGAGSAVLEALQRLQINKPVLCLGLPDAFIEHGDPAKLLAMQGLDATGIEASILARFA